MSPPMAQAALWLLVLLPAVVGGALALSRLERAAVPMSLATAVLTAVLSLFVALARPQVSVPFMAGSDLALRHGLGEVLLGAADRFQDVRGALNSLSDTLLFPQSRDAIERHRSLSPASSAAA